MHRILLIGPQWRGSNAGGLFKALARQGHLTEIVDENYFISLNSKKNISKLLNRSIRYFQTIEFNHAICDLYKKFDPELVLIYKGAFILPQTIHYLKSRAIVVNFYPDVSFHTHGRLLLKTLPLYHQVYTTKTFGVSDMKQQMGIQKVFFMPHGFDPEVHRDIEIDDKLTENFICDVSFIGTYSSKKAMLLDTLKRSIPSLNMKIWGAQWEKCNYPSLSTSIQHQIISGDLYALGIIKSKISLALLSERVKGASSGDLITSRTFHIPACNGFMLHERNEEVLQYFEENKEAVYFDSQEELIEKVKYYLENESKRKEIKNAGYSRALKDHSLDNRSIELINRIYQNK